MEWNMCGITGCLEMFGEKTEVEVEYT